MPSDFTVDWASPPGDPYGQANDNVAYWIKLKEDTQNRSIMLGQKIDKPAPVVGQQLFGDITEQQKKSGQGTYWKFQKAQRQDGSYSGGGNRSAPKGKDEAYKADPAKLRSEAIRSAIHHANEAVPGAIKEGGKNALDSLIAHFYGLIMEATLDDSDERLAEKERAADDAQRRSEDGF